MKVAATNRSKASFKLRPGKVKRRAQSKMCSCQDSQAGPDGRKYRSGKHAVKNEDRI